MAIEQSSSSKKPNKSDKNNSPAIVSVWLIMALLMGAATLALWMFSAAPVFDNTEAEDKENMPAEVEAFNIKQIDHIDALNELQDDVKPISFNTLIRDLRDYPAEFKDARYLKKNKGKWTLTVMDVSERDIITDYLDSRKDRDKFAFFRYKDANGESRYILTYGVMQSKAAATSKMESVNLELPANVDIKVAQLGSYLDVIENYELSEPVKDLSANRARNVRLQPSSREIDARQVETTREEKRNSGNTIQGSNNANDTLSIQNDQQVISSNNSGVASASTNQNNSRPRANETNSNPEQSNKPQNNNNNSSAGSSGEVDRIKQLIEEKTQ